LKNVTALFFDHGRRQAHKIRRHEEQSFNDLLQWRCKWESAAAFAILYDIDFIGLRGARRRPPPLSSDVLRAHASGDNWFEMCSLF
jgi:hypothetical protein